MLGSDVSYEDLTGGKTLLDTYEVSYEGMEEIDGHQTYRVSLEARRRNVAYPRQTLWIDAQLFTTRKATERTERTALKTITFHDIQEVDGYHVPMETRVSDALKRNSSTVMTIDTIEIDLRLRGDLFSLEELSW